MDLGLFVIEQAHEFVVLLDRFQGLDEYGLSAGAGAVNHALHAALQFQRGVREIATEDFARNLELQAQVVTILTQLQPSSAPSSGQPGSCRYCC